MRPWLVEEQEFPIASLHPSSLSLSHSFFLFSRSTRQPRGEYTFLDKRVTWRRGNACPLSQDSIRTSLESKYGGIAVNISSRVFFFPRRKRAPSFVDVLERKFGAGGEVSRESFPGKDSFPLIRYRAYRDDRLEWIFDNSIRLVVYIVIS